MLNSELREQLILFKDVARRFLSDCHTFEQRRRIIDRHPGYSLEQWQAMAELGWMKLPIGASYDGLGCRAEFVAALIKEFGRSLYLNPYLISVGVASRILEWAAPEPMKTKLLEGIGNGTEIVSCAFYEAQSRYELDNVLTTAVPRNDGYELNGAKVAILYGIAATQLLVLARTSGHSTDSDGLSLYLVPACRRGVSLKHYSAHDGGRISLLTLNQVQISSQRLVGNVDRALSFVQRGINYGIALACAEMAGIMETVLDLSLTHIKTRTQFGKTIGSFQAIQHRAVDMYMRCELANSMSSEAVRAVEELDLPQQNLVVSAAKLEIGNAAVLNAEEGIQLHGAMGMMDEMPIGHCLKRIFSLNLMFGDPDHHLNNYRRLSLEQRAN